MPLSLAEFPLRHFPKQEFPLVPRFDSELLEAVQENVRIF
jgi:hypothetical protein